MTLLKRFYFVSILQIGFMVSAFFVALLTSVDVVIWYVVVGFFLFAIPLALYKVRLRCPKCGKSIGLEPVFENSSSWLNFRCVVFPKRRCSRCHEVL